MSNIQKYIKNNTGSEITIEGLGIAASAYYLIQPTEEVKFSSSSILLSHIGDATVLMAKTNDGQTDITDVNEGIDFLKQLLNPNFNINSMIPFASKTLPDGKKIFKRKHGVLGSSIVAGQSSMFLFTVPYTSCKITEMEVVGCKTGDQVNFKILDTDEGTVTTIPNYPLNQFGFSVVMPDGFFREQSQYDADLFVGLVLSIEYTNNGTEAITPSFNITLHEVKT